MEDQGQLKHGTKVIKINDSNHTYTGPLDANGNAFGEGEAVSEMEILKRAYDGATYRGYFKDD